MMLFDKAGAAKLRVVCLTDSVMLTPNASSANEYGDELLDVKPTTGAILEGQVVLTLPTAKRCRKIRVELVSYSFTSLRY